MRPQLLPNLGPRIEMVPRGNRAANPLHLPHAPELLEGLRAIDARLVHARRLVDVIRAAVTRHGALFRRPRAGVVRAVGLDDVVFDEGRARPAVERDVRVDVCGVPCTCEKEC